MAGQKRNYLIRLRARSDLYTPITQDPDARRRIGVAIVTLCAPHGHNPV
jgi:hypothetical protein